MCRRVHTTIQLDSFSIFFAVLVVGDQPSHRWSAKILKQCVVVVKDFVFLTKDVDGTVYDHLSNTMTYCPVQRLTVNVRFHW